MRAVFSVLGLVIVVAIIAMVARKQLTSLAPSPGVAAPGAEQAAPAPQQRVQQMRQAADAALQAPRQMPDDTK